MSGVFPGRFVRMLPYPETGVIYMEYRPGSLGSVYGQLAMIRGDESYLLNHSTIRVGDFGKGNDRLLPVWAMEDSILAYWENCEPGATINAEVKVLDYQAVAVPLTKKRRLGSYQKSEKPLIAPEKGSLPETTAEESPAIVESTEAKARQVESVPTGENFVGERTTDWMEPLNGSRDYGILEAPAED